MHTPVEEVVDLPPKEPIVDVVEAIPSAFSIEKEGSLGKKLDVAIHMIALENRVFTHAGISPQIHIDGDLEQRRNRYELLRS